MVDKRPIYICCVIGSLICLCIERFIIKKNPKLLIYTLWIFEFMFLFMGASMSLITCRNETAVLFPVMGALVPLLFTDSSINIILIETGVNIIYIVGTILLRPQEIWALEIVNAIVFNGTGLLISYYMTHVKFERHLYEINIAELYELRNKDALTDQLTGLFNRRAFYEDLEKDKDELLIIASADITGLKHVNDTYGHQAGDILINGSASILCSSFSSLGKVYRVGGDEFLLLLHGTEQQVEKAIDEMRTKEKELESSFQNGLNIAIGYASQKENRKMNSEGLVYLADQRIYESKTYWYTSSGITQRKR